VARFSVVERLLHWLLAGCTLTLLVSGLMLYLPSLATVVDRPTAKAWHLDAAIVLAVGFTLLVVLRFGELRRTARQLDRWDRDDVHWLAGGPGRLVSGAMGPPQGRFNAGQKLNAALVGGLMVVMYVTGFLLWYGERDTTYRFAGTVTVHDWITWILTLLISGHVYLAVLHPTTRHALRGMTLGSVDRSWAFRHHRKWVEELESEPAAVEVEAPSRTTEPVA
jgi:formate dehydrogenase subunit gamma